MQRGEGNRDINILGDQERDKDLSPEMRRMDKDPASKWRVARHHFETLSRYVISEISTAADSPG